MVAGGSVVVPNSKSATTQNEKQGMLRLHPQAKDMVKLPAAGSGVAAASVLGSSREMRASRGPPGGVSDAIFRRKKCGLGLE